VINIYILGPARYINVLGPVITLPVLIKIYIFSVYFVVMFM